MNQPSPKTNASASPAASAARAAAKPVRLMSLDALRGFDMFWIVGADALVEALRKSSDGRVAQGLAGRLEHASWAGFHFEDLIFPMLGLARLGPALRLDRDEPDHDLYDSQPGGCRADCAAVRWR